MLAGRGELPSELEDKIDAHCSERRLDQPDRQRSLTEGGLARGEE